MLVIRNVLLTLLFSLFLVSGTFAQNQPTFNSGQDPKPSGKVWEKVENMSDEFNDGSFNTQKWDNQFSGWQGREPGLFTTDAVSETGGNLRITVDFLTQQEKNQNPGFDYQGGLVRSLNKLTGNDKYGYYECRFKANKTFMSTTFWLINQRGELNGCDKRVTELDIVETVGLLHPNTQQWAKDAVYNEKMNTNTHSRQLPAGCNFPTGSNGERQPLGEQSWEGYHVYGCWWKSPTEIEFYLDGQYMHTITPPASFDIEMYLRLVVETYNWNPPNGTTNPATGLRYDGVNDNFNNRTSYYDWVRTWKLVDGNGGGGGGNCNLPVTIPNQTISNQTVNQTFGPYDISCASNVDITLTATGTGSMENSDYLNIYYKVNGGSQVAMLEHVNSYPQQTLTANNISGNSIELIIQGATSVGSEIYTVNNISISESSGGGGGGGGTPDVDCNSLPSSVPTSTAIDVSVDYTSDQNRDVVIELWNTTTNSYIDQGSTTVGAGSGTATVTINISPAPTAGSNYQFKASIRPVGANWTQNLDACNKSNISLTSGGGGASCDVPWTTPNQSITQTTQNWTSPSIDISCVSSVDISMDIEGLTPAVMEAADYLNIYYKVDGGSQIAISENTDGFALTTVSANNVSGNSLQLIINGKTSWSDETYNITNISVQASSGARRSNGELSESSPGAFTVYPNPVNLNGVFNLSLGELEGEKQIAIFDMTGRLVYEHSTVEPEFSTKASRVFGAKGMYLIRLQSKTVHQTVKFLVK